MLDCEQAAQGLIGWMIYKLPPWEVTGWKCLYNPTNATYSSNELNWDMAHNLSGVKPSWTARLLQNPQLLCSKVREEAGELCQTWEQQEGKHRAVSEMADLLYHAMVLLNVQVRRHTSPIAFEGCLSFPGSLNCVAFVFHAGFAPANPFYVASFCMLL